MRLFIAIQFEEDILQALAKLQSEWKNLGMQGHAAPPQNLHLTLAFIGEYGNPDAVLDAMATVPFPRFSLRLDGIGNFGDFYWAGIAENKALTGYVQRLRRALAEHNIPYDRKRFSPHITLIRKAVFHDSVDRLLRNPPTDSMEVASIALMSSTRGKNGMIYTRIGSVEAD